MRDLVPFVQFTKRKNHPWRSVQPATLLKLTLLHGCFLLKLTLLHGRFLNVQMVPNRATHHLCLFILSTMLYVNISVSFCVKANLHYNFLYIIFLIIHLLNYGIIFHLFFFEINFFFHSESYLEPSWTSAMKIFCEISWRLLTVNYFHIKAFWKKERQSKS